MPFDGNPEETDRLRDNVLARLELLQEIAAKTNGDQNEFRTCLWSEVRRSPELMRLAGRRELAGNRETGPQDHSAASQYFGLYDRDLWSSMDLQDKRRIINRRLAQLRREAANAV